MTELAQLLVEWEAVIGLEVHVQLATASKAFSPSAVLFGAPPNSLTDPTVLGLPGALPVYNARALELALALGLATTSRIRMTSRFARKHYFYPDQPKNYQISQYDEPLCEHGVVDVFIGGELRRVELTRIHLEEDAGKNTHVGATSHVDLDRAGVPLVEVVTEPVMHTPEEAAEFVRALHGLVRWLGISEADMEKGQLRCDANVSVRRRGEDRLGTRTELKNINSFRFIQHAVEHEIARQLRLLDGGGRVERETRLWDAVAGQSQTMRTKEEANDYRYFPDPDLPPLVVDPAQLDAIERGLPELPAARFRRYTRSGVGADEARTLVGERALADYMDAVVAAHGDEASAKVIGNWILTELLGALRAAGLEVAASPLAPVTLAALVRLVEDGTISGKIGKEVFEESFRTGEAPAAIVERRGVQQISNEAELGAIVERVVTGNQRQADGYAGGNDKLFGFFVGQVMKETGGRANPVLTTTLLKKRLGR